MTAKTARIGGAKAKSPNGLKGALYLHVDPSLLERLDRYVEQYSEEHGVSVSRADIVRKFLDKELRMVEEDRKKKVEVVESQ